MVIDNNSVAVDDGYKINKKLDKKRSGLEWGRDKKITNERQKNKTNRHIDMDHRLRTVDLNSIYIFSLIVF